MKSTNYIGLLLLFAVVHIAKARQTDAFRTKEVLLVFSIIQKKGIYEASAYGEPPQFAIWLQNRQTGELRTVFVTEKTGKGSYEGKVGVPVALPAWVSAYRIESGVKGFPTLRNPVVDGITGPTSRSPSVEHQVSVDEGSEWTYYIEVNVAGDYNEVFPPFHEDGTPDADANGQPSLIYSGEIDAHPGNCSQAKIMGRTEQLFYTDTVNRDLNGMTTATQIFHSIVVHCRPQVR